MNSGLFHPWIRVLRRSAVAYGDTLFSAIFLRYNFPRCSAQGGFANICSSDARVEIELYSHCFLQSLTYLTEHAQGRNSPLFHWHLWGTQVFPNFLPDGLLKMEDGLRATQAQKPPEVTGTVHWDTSARRDWTQGTTTSSGKVIPGCSRKAASLYGGYVNMMKSPCVRREGAFTGQSFHWVIFLYLEFSHFGKNPFLALPGENSQHEAVVFWGCFV